MATNRAFTPDNEEYEITTQSGEKKTVQSSGVGGKTGGWDTGVYGTAILQSAGSGADMSRRAGLAGKTAVSNGYTVTYDDKGYATKAVKGVTDYLPQKDYYVGNGTYNGGSLWTDEEMLSAKDLAAIQGYRNQIAAGTMTSAQANELANKIRAGYGYTIDKSGNVYDSGLSTTAYLNREKQGLSNGALNDAQKQYLQLMFEEQETQDNNALLQAFDSLQQGKHNPTQKRASTAGALSATGLQMGGYSDMTKYLEDMYANNLEAELAALKSAYDTNVAELESQNDKIAEQYRAARNQAAAQNEMEKQSMNERALATGLNTGTSGQIALAQNMAYQGNLGNLYAQQARDESASNLAMAELLRGYNADVNRTAANINAQKAQAMYSELIRQEEMAAAAEQRAAAEREAALERELAAQETSRNYALTMLQNGMMPDDATLASAGLSPTEADLWYQYGVQANAPKYTGTPKPVDTGMDLKVAQQMAEYGVFNDDVLAAFAKEGYTPDYLAAAYGYTGLGSPVENDAPVGPGVDNTQFGAYKNYIIQTMQNGDNDRASKMLDSVWNQLSIQQRNELQERLSALGVKYTP